MALGGGIKPARADCAGTESWPHPLFSPSVLLWFPPTPIIPKQKAKSMKDGNAILTGQRAGSQRFTVGSAGAKEKSQHAVGDWAGVDFSPESARSRLSARNLKAGAEHQPESEVG